MGDNSDKKKKYGSAIILYPYMKFQNISINGFKVMLCTRKQQH